MSIGVALSGGGLKCIAHVGALQALKELGVKIDYISGTSSGAIIAGTYALGYTENEIEEIVKKYYKVYTKFDKTSIFKAVYSFATKGKVDVGGLIDGKKIETLIGNIANKKEIKNVSDIKIPFAAVAVDTITTKECVFLSDKKKLPESKDVEYVYDIPVAKAIRASSAFPGIFTSCGYKDYDFIDGGTKDNLPVKILKDMGADKTIALAFKLDEYTPSNDVFATMLRACDLFSQRKVEESIKIADLPIVIDASGTGLLEIENTKKCYMAGYNSVMENKTKIIDMLT